MEFQQKLVHYFKEQPTKIIPFLNTTHLHSKQRTWKYRFCIHCQQKQVVLDVYSMADEYLLLCQQCGKLTSGINRIKSVQQIFSQEFLKEHFNKDPRYGMNISEIPSWENQFEQQERNTA